MWVWDSTTFIATSKDEGGPVSTYRWEMSEEDHLPPLSLNASRSQRIGRGLCYLMLAGMFGFMWWAFPI